MSEQTSGIFSIKTQFGSFKLTVTDTYKYNIMSREKIIDGKIITIGARNKCVSIDIKNNSQIAHFLNIKQTDGGCELNEKLIKGKLTIQMICLTFTAVKKYAPHITHIRLEDKSDFPCKRTDGSTVGISLALYEMMFHNATWYERHFKATLINENLHNMYITSKNNINNKPPEHFSFNNTALNELLKSKLTEATSWKYFFNYIYTLPNKCEIIFPWYKNAIQTIFNEINFERQNWIINLQDIPNCTSIPYEEIKQLGGSRNKTRKQLQKQPNELPTWASYSYDEHMNHSYDWLKEML